MTRKWPIRYKIRLIGYNGVLMPQTLKEVLKDKNIFEQLNGKKTSEKLKVLVTIATDLTKAALPEKPKGSPDTKSRDQNNQK